jgi:hypothetical protein
MAFQVSKILEQDPEEGHHQFSLPTNPIVVLCSAKHIAYDHGIPFCLKNYAAHGLTEEGDIEFAQ